MQVVGGGCGRKKIGCDVWRREGCDKGCNDVSGVERCAELVCGVLGLDVRI